MPTRVAILGGSGFIGSNIARRFIGAGNDVMILDVLPPPNGVNCDYIRFDLAEHFVDDVPWGTFSHVVIAAGLLGAGCGRTPSRAWDVNVSSTIRLLSRIIELQARPRIIFLSSGMVYDAQFALPPFSEECATRARCLYTASKLCVESALSAAGAGGMLASLILRPFTVYGDGPMLGERGHLFGKWLELGRFGKLITVFGDGGQIIDPVPVERISNACIAYSNLRDPPATMIVNVTSGGYTTVSKLAEMFVETGLAPGFQLLAAEVPDVRRGYGCAVALESLMGAALPRDPAEEVRSFLRGLTV